MASASTTTPVVDKIDGALIVNTQDHRKLNLEFNCCGVVVNVMDPDDSYEPDFHESDESDEDIDELLGSEEEQSSEELESEEEDK